MYKRQDPLNTEFLVTAACNMFEPENVEALEDGGISVQLSGEKKSCLTAANSITFEWIYDRIHTAKDVRAIKERVAKWIDKAIDKNFLIPLRGIVLSYGIDAGVGYLGGYDRDNDLVFVNLHELERQAEDQCHKNICLCLTLAHELRHLAQQYRWILDGIYSFKRDPEVDAEDYAHHVVTHFSPPNIFWGRKGV